jgi:hypothetical protein
LQQLHGFTSQNKGLFTTTAVRISHPKKLLITLRSVGENSKWPPKGCSPKHRIGMHSLSPDPHGEYFCVPSTSFYNLKLYVASEILGFWTFATVRCSRK